MALKNQSVAAVRVYAVVRKIVMREKAMAIGSFCGAYRSSRHVLCCAIALAMATVPYVALCAWISGMVDSLFASLIDW